ncbi:hypothetical protein [Rhizobium sp. 768_B6_N1_8]|uniref:hypothetical protein n=1 Tax=unclassified Rhizobium TaxID=2613769 RepID=UPI003F274646
MNATEEKTRRANYAVRQPGAKLRGPIDETGSVWNDCAGRMRLRPARIGVARSGLSPSRLVKSWRSLRNLEEFRKEPSALDTSHGLDLYSAARRYVASLPSHDSRLINRRRKELAEILKGHPIMLFAISGDFRFLAHVASGCITCNLWQAEMLYDALTKISPLACMVAK